MSVIIKGVNAFDMSIVSNIKNVESQYIKFQNIYFKCKSIEDAGGTIFVKRKKGKWLHVDTEVEENCEYPYGWMPWYCSECGTGVGKHQTAFCPNCGADMRGEQE